MSMKPWTDTVPYEHAVAGEGAKDEAAVFIDRYGGRLIGFDVDHYGNIHAVTFAHSGYEVRMFVAALGYAAKLQQAGVSHPEAMARARIAVWSMLRDMVKSALVPVFTQALPITTACMGYIVGEDGRTMGQRASAGDVIRLPPPDRSVG
jgi:hypothetical protein